MRADLAIFLKIFGHFRRVYLVCVQFLCCWANFNDHKLEKKIVQMVTLITVRRREDGPRESAVHSQVDPELGVGQ